jgi:hypothetical protein
MIKRTIILLFALCFAVQFLSAETGDLDDYDWDIRIAPIEGEPGKYIFDASLRRFSSSGNNTSEDVLRVPRMTVIAGKEAHLEMKAPDRRPALRATVFIDEGASKVRYSVMVRTDEGTHSSSANLDLSANKPEAGNGVEAPGQIDHP